MSQAGVAKMPIINRSENSLFPSSSIPLLRAGRRTEGIRPLPGFSCCDDAQRRGNQATRSGAGRTQPGDLRSWGNADRDLECDGAFG